jgi:hypothetical protein
MVLGIHYGDDTYLHAFGDKAAWLLFWIVSLAWILAQMHENHVSVNHGEFYIHFFNQLAKNLFLFAQIVLFEMISISYC